MYKGRRMAKLMILFPLSVMAIMVTDCGDDEGYVRLNTDSDYVVVTVLEEGEEEGEETISLYYDTGAEIGTATVKPANLPIDSENGVDVDVYLDEGAVSDLMENAYSIAMVELSIEAGGYEGEDPLSLYLYGDALDSTHFYITLVPDGTVEGEREDLFTFKVWGTKEEE